MSKAINLLTPEERELEKKRLELAELESKLVQKELELITLQAELESFEHIYLSVVGCLYRILDEVEAEIAEIIASLEPTNEEAQEQAKQANEKAKSSYLITGGRKPNTDSSMSFFPSEELKKLYREAAKLVHPDLATDDKERILRHKAMVEVNNAYANYNKVKLKEVKIKWESSPELVTGEGVAAELVRAIRKIAQIEERLQSIEIEISQLKNTDLYKFKLKIEAQKSEGLDLLELMAERIRQDIRVARTQLEELKKVKQNILLQKQLDKIYEDLTSWDYDARVKALETIIKNSKSLDLSFDWLDEIVIKIVDFLMEFEKDNRQLSLFETEENNFLNDDYISLSKNALRSIVGDFSDLSDGISWIFVSGNYEQKVKAVNWLKKNDPYTKVTQQSILWLFNEGSGEDKIKAAEWIGEYKIREGLSALQIVLSQPKSEILSLAVRCSIARLQEDPLELFYMSLAYLVTASYSDLLKNKVREYIVQLAEDVSNSAIVNLFCILALGEDKANRECAYLLLERLRDIEDEDFSSDELIKLKRASNVLFTPTKSAC